LERTGGRRAVVAFGASLAFISFLDRAAISPAAPSIIRDLHLEPVQMGLVFSVFGLTYAAGEIPSGWLCDRFGARSVLTRVVLWWSFFTAATGWVWNYPSLLVMRLLFGAGESGCFPGLARLFRAHLAPMERNTAEGVKAASARWGAAITPALMAALSSWLTWRQVFFIFGLVGVVWAAAFRWWYHGAAQERRETEQDISWRRVVRSRSVWGLGIQWFCHYYGFYFYITWLPQYLYQARGFDLRRGALAAGLPLFAAGLGSLFAGWALSGLTRRTGTARARKLMGYAAYGGAALLLLVFTSIRNPITAMAVMSLSSFAAEFSGPISWTTAMDIAGDRVGAVSGFMNMLGHLGGSVAPAITGFLLSFTGNAWNRAFYCSAAIYAAGAVCWAVIDPVTPLHFSKALPSRLGSATG
jgi:MFS family permease